MNQPQIGAGAHALWRGVNETIAAAARLAHEPTATFVCECGSYACVERIEAAVDEYDRVRSDPTRFLLVAGHEAFVPVPDVADAPIGREATHLSALPTLV
jgi:hypothetical protein